jgi:hypothetical protein
MLRFPEGFRAAAAGGRKRTSQIAVPETLFDFRASNELVKKPSIETISRSNGVHSRNFWRFSFKRF